MKISIKLDETVSVTLEPVTIFLASYLSWVSRWQVHATFRPIISYRGHAKAAEWELLPSLCRQKLPIEIIEQQESEIINEFRCQFDLSGWTDLEVLAYARHHGAPTRLLDWSRNPFVALWFTVADKTHDQEDGVVFQLRLPDYDCSVISFTPTMHLPAKNEGAYKQPVWIFNSPSRVDRTQRQRSVFTLASFNGGYALKPLDHIGKPDKPLPIDRFPVPAKFKCELRRLLSRVGLDAYSIYGGPDSLGKALVNHFDISDLNPPSELPSDATKMKANDPPSSL